MPDWLVPEVSSEVPTGAEAMVLRLIMALAFGVVVASVYCLSHGRTKSDARAMATTLVLLSVLIAMVSMVIGNSVARAFSLVGALSIVRFRTVVDDTRDTAFVIFAVIVGMAVGAGLWMVPVAGIPVAGLAAVALARWSDAAGGSAALDGTLSIRLGLGRDPRTLQTDVLPQYVERFRPISTATARQGSALELTYAIRLRSEAAMIDLVSELNRVEGVQSVELHRT